MQITHCYFSMDDRKIFEKAMIGTKKQIMSCPHVLDEFGYTPQTLNKINKELIKINHRLLDDRTTLKFYAKKMERAKRMHDRHSWRMNKRVAMFYVETLKQHKQKIKTLEQIRDNLKKLI